MNFKKFCEERGWERLYFSLLPGKKMVDDWIASKRLIKIDRDVRRIRNGLSSKYFPEMIDWGQVMRRDGRTHNWGGHNYYSQCGQDWFVDYLFNQKENGFYLDIGGNDPVIINNTYYFERRGWNGIAFEPLAKYQNKWKDIRKAPCLPIALGNEEKSVSFVEMDQDVLSGIKGINEEKIRFHWKKLEHKEKQEIVVQQRMLKDVLEEYGVSEVDYVSLDVEGYELQVLKGIDFSKVDIKCFSIENEDGYESIFKIRKFMVESGYRLIARLGQDDIFVNTKLFWNLR